MSTNTKRVAALSAIVPALLAQACVTNPYNGQDIHGIGAPVNVSGFTHEPDVPLTVEVANARTGAWELLGTVTSASTPTIEAETWKNSPPLYWYETSVQVFDPDDPRTLERWGSGASRDLDALVATLRVRSGDDVLGTGEERSVSCVQNASPTVDFSTTTSECGFRQGDVWVRSDRPSSGVVCTDYSPKRCAQEGWCVECDYGCTVCRR